MYKYSPSPSPSSFCVRYCVHTYNCPIGPYLINYRYQFSRKVRISKNYTNHKSQMCSGPQNHPNPTNYTEFDKYTGNRNTNLDWFEICIK